MRSGSCASRGLFGSKSGSDTIATISPVLTLETRPEAAFALYLSLALSSSSRSACSTRRSIDSSTGPCRRSGAKPPRGGGGGKGGGVEIGQTVFVEPFFHPGDALVVDIDETDQVRDFGAGGI